MFQLNDVHVIFWTFIAECFDRVSYCEKFDSGLAHWYGTLGCWTNFAKDNCKKTCSLCERGMHNDVFFDINILLLWSGLLKYIYFTFELFCFSGCLNTWGDEGCKKHEQNGLCTKSTTKSWMISNCNKACGNCDGNILQSSIID